MTKTKHARDGSQSSNNCAKPVDRIRTWPFPSFLGILVILVTTSVVGACGQFGDSDAAGGSATDGSSTSANQPLTVEEYAQACSTKRISDFDTVFDLVDDLKEGLEKYRGIEPPRELREFHDANIKRREAMIIASRRLPGSQRPHEYMFLPQQASELYRADDERNFVLFDLDPDIRDTLRRHGCIE